MTARALAYWAAAPVGGALVILFSLPFIPLILLWGAWDALRLLGGAARSTQEKGRRDRGQ